MFERRLKLFVVLIVVISLTLFGRVFEVQVVAHSYWEAEAAGLLTKSQVTETTRGRILDIHGTPLALDTPCTDACVDYRAIIDPPDGRWVQTIALARLRNRLGADYKNAKTDQRKTMLADEVKQTLSDINNMWATLASLNAKVDTGADRQAAMKEIRQRIVQAVQARRQDVASLHLQEDQARESASSRWLKWLARSHDEDSDVDNLSIIQEQQEPHVILAALDSDSCNLLGKQLEHLPGLQLRASTHRSYPLDTVACHLLGSLGEVSGNDLAQARKNNLDELRMYRANDLIGRQGVEELCEPLLRGSRGKIEQRVSDNTIISRQDFVPGSDVRLSIDADLQKQAQYMLQHVEEHVHDDNNQLITATPEGGVSMHAAVVMLDVKTNEVRVLASNPGFNVNDLQDKDRYAALASDEYNQPLIDRATSDTCEPGSTVKPLIGLGAITDGVLGATDTIRCTGYLFLPAIGPDGKLHQLPLDGGARCWILSENPREPHNPAYHNRYNVPADAQHGPLTYAEALERSCDIFFQTAADRLTPPRLNYWFDQFGFGRPTGIGIFERAGIRPDTLRGGRPLSRVDYCLSGMGQGAVLATPLQIANEAATIARNGVWMRPRLLSTETQAALDGITSRSNVNDQNNLSLNAEALNQARIGMVNVVDGGAGTGKLKHPGFSVAAKTGTAETGALMIKKTRLEPVHLGGEETATPWYRSGKTTGYSVIHSWYMGYAPVENPQIAFCVLIEYAGAGGSAAAGPVAMQMLEACDRGGYLHPHQASPQGTPMAFNSEAAYEQPATRSPDRNAGN